jgi:isopenicillin-N N-acyltransferase-like protein
VVTFTSTPLPPRERGLELGERFRAEIADAVGRYRTLFGVHGAAGGRDGFDIDDWSEQAWESITRLTPAYAEEIAGIAEGAGLPAREIAAVNARTEILVGANPAAAVALSECSTVVALPEGLAPVAAQTWDWYDAMAGGWLHWTIPYPDGRVVQTVTEFGMLAKIGVNDAGLGVMLNMLHHAADEQASADGRIGYPVHLLSRTLLDEAGSVKEAVSIASEASTTASTSLTVVDRDGEAASIELFPGGPGILEPTHGLLVRTNHFVSREGAPGCIAHTLSNSTRVRRDHLLSAFSTPPDSPAQVLDAMHHHDPEGGVCRHIDPALPPVLRARTLATVVIDVEESHLDVRRGGPCAA